MWYTKRTAQTGIVPQFKPKMNPVINQGIQQPAINQNPQVQGSDRYEPLAEDINNPLKPSVTTPVAQSQKDLHFKLKKDPTMMTIQELLEQARTNETPLGKLEQPLNSQSIGSINSTDPSRKRAGEFKGPAQGINPNTPGNISPNL